MEWNGCGWGEEDEEEVVECAGLASASISESRARSTRLPIDCPLLATATTGEQSAWRAERSLHCWRYRVTA